MPTDAELAKVLVALDWDRWTRDIDVVRDTRLPSDTVLRALYDLKRRGMAIDRMGNGGIRQWTKRALR